MGEFFLKKKRFLFKMESFLQMMSRQAVALGLFSQFHFNVLSFFSIGKYI
jgi:hypothetical protein